MSAYPLVPREAARTPLRFRERVLAAFRSPMNRAYLRDTLAARTPSGSARAYVIRTLDSAVHAYAAGDGRAVDLLQSDELALRGSANRAADMWSEVRRLNRAFVSDRFALMREQPLIAGSAGGASWAGGVIEDEPYHVRMFEYDSLRPPGLEHLNAPGPLYALREEQAKWTGREDFQSKPGESSDSFEPPSAPGDPDAAWGPADPSRSASQALAEYWGDGWTETEAARGDERAFGRAYDDPEARPADPESSGTRYMRYTGVPFWQMGGREGYDHDIEETLGTQARELGGQVRRWDMSRLTAPRGQEYRRFGARSGGF